MNKILKSLFLACIILTAGACTEEVEFNPTGQPEGNQVYFANTLNSRVEISKKENSFIVPVSRSLAGEAITVDIESHCSEKLAFDIPSSVSFAEGETEALFQISYNPSHLSYEEWSKIKLRISSENDTTPYGDTEYAFTVGIPAPYKSLGMGTYTETFLAEAFGLSTVTYPVEVLENELKPNYFRLKNPYGEAYPFSALGSYDKSRDYFVEIDATDPEGVYMPMSNTGFTLMAEYGFCYTWSIADMYMQQGNTLAQAKKQGMCGVFENGVITFPAKSLIFITESGAGTYVNMKQDFMLAMPGVEVHDYEITLSYKGHLTDGKGRKYALADMTMGEDVNYIKVGVCPATGDMDALEAFADAIADGSQSADKFTESGEIKVSCFKPGDYYMVAVPFDVEDKAQEPAVYITFTVEGGGESSVPAITDYEGTYTVEGLEYTTESEEPIARACTVTLKAAEYPTDNGNLPVIVMTGLKGFDGYTSSVMFPYDEELGTLFMTLNSCAPYEAPNGDVFEETYFCPAIITQQGSLDTMDPNTDEITGSLDADGNLVFVNDPANRYQFNSMAFFVVAPDPTSGEALLYLNSPLWNINFSASALAASAAAHTEAPWQKPANGKMLMKLMRTANALDATALKSLKHEGRMRVMYLNATPKFMDNAIQFNVNR